MSDQTPPDFSWPRYPKAEKYEVELRFPNGRMEKRQVERNWLLWDGVLPTGHYSWRVSAKSERTEKSVSSSWRQFGIRQNAKEFWVPGDDELISRAKAKSHPRAFPTGESKRRLLSSLESDRRAAWDDLLSGLRKPDRAGEVSQLPAWMARAQGQKAYSVALGNAKREAGKDFERMLDAAFAFMVTGREQYRNEAIAKLRDVSRWTDRGASGVSHHQVAGRYTWILALTYDWLYPYLSAEDRRQVVNAVGSRIEDLLAEFRIPEGKLDNMPYNSHAWVALGEMAAASSLLVGDDERAKGWFQATVRPFIQSVSPWAGPEGGMANGTGYGVWDLTALLIPMDVIGYTLDINVYDKAPLRNMMSFLMQFVPPGSPSGAFGDAAENDPDLWVGDFARAFSLRAPSSTASWYARQWQPRKYSLMHVYAPTQVGMPAKRDMAPSENGMLAETLGWVAMHSDINDKNRTSVYFKSSPYGSFNHSHADQNSFVVTSAGIPVFIDSGYYDFFKSEHWSGWYTRTQAHNAITFDGGDGQKLEDRGASGNILSFDQTTEFDVVRGDATRAYDGAVDKAMRTLVFIRPNKLIIVDNAASLKPRNWEWNIHALTPFAKIDNNSMRVSYGNKKACLSVVPSGTFSFSQSQGFPVSPDPKWGRERQVDGQWHGVFKSDKPVRGLGFVSLIELDCTSPSPFEVVAINGKSVISVGGVKIEVAGDGTVRKLY